MKKKIINHVKPVVIVLFILLASFSIGSTYDPEYLAKTGDNSMPAYDAYGERTFFAEGVKRPTAELYSTPVEKINKYKKMKTFDYPLKKVYSSREEVLNEWSDLHTSYMAFTDFKTHDEIKKVKIVYDELDSQLRDILKKFPPSEEEIEQHKVDYFFSVCWLRYDEWYRINIRIKSNPKDEGIDKECALITSAYEIMLEVRADYCNGKITVDEACKQIGIKEEHLVLEDY